MQGEFFLKPNKINVENMCALSEENSVSYEKRMCEISELCDSLCSGISELSHQGFGIYEILGFVSDSVDLTSQRPHSFSLGENKAGISKYLEMLSAADKALFSEMLTEKMKRSGLSFGEADFLPTGQGEGVVAYVKNRLADEAYDVFFDSLPSLKVLYTDSLKSAARLVAKGKAEYCLLPLEEKGGARLAGVAALLFSYDLKIASVTPVFGFDGSADVKYALVSSHFSIPKINSDDDRYLEIRVAFDYKESVSSLFLASEFLGVSLYRINTVKFDTEEGEESYYTIVFKGEGKDFSAFLVFLTLFVTSYSAIGIYKNLE